MQLTFADFSVQQPIGGVKGPQPDASMQPQPNLASSNLQRQNEPAQIQAQTTPEAALENNPPAYSTTKEQ